MGRRAAVAAAAQAAATSEYLLKGPHASIFCSTTFDVFFSSSNADASGATDWSCKGMSRELGSPCEVSAAP